MEKVLHNYGINKKDLKFNFTHLKVRTFSFLWWTLVSFMIAAPIITASASIHILCQIATQITMNIH